MTMARGLESLSTELFDQILSHVTTYDERRSLSSVSRHLNKKMIPHLYNSWCFDGNKHTFRSLHYFLRSILLNPEIASHVRKLDIRKWGIDEPEDYPMSDGSDGGTYDDYAREEGDDETDRPANEQPAENSEDENSAAALPDEGYEGDIPLFRNAINNYGFDEATIEWFIEWIQKQDPDILLAILLIKLPNLTKLNMAIPESQSAIPQLVEMLLGQETPLFLRNLETINLCSSLHMGIKGHREYDIEAPRIFPFLQIPSLRNLSALELTGFNPYIPDFKAGNVYPLYNTSPVTSLSFDESAAEPLDLISVLGIPKQLQSFRWNGQWSCYSIGSCITPFYHHLGEALNKHKATLETLELDLRKYKCSGKGHAGNPAVKLEDMLPSVRENWRDDLHLIGSLKDFSRLKSLTIDSQALCGDSLHGVSTTSMVDILPPSIEELNFNMTLEPPGKKRKQQMEPIVNLAHAARDIFPRLKKIEILTTWVRRGDAEDDEVWKELEMACRLGGIGFEVRGRSGYTLTPEKFFQEVLSTNNPGRDY